MNKQKGAIHPPLKKSDPQKNYDWLVWPQTYFDSAVIDCEWLIKKIYHELYLHSKTRDNQEYKPIQPIKYLILPIIYKLKHGIEIYLKGLLVVYKGEYDPNSHDLIYLLNLLISKILESKTIKEKQKFLGFLDKDIRNIIEKYYYGLYLGKNRYKNLPDIQNQAERYPEQKSYEIPEIFSCWVQQSLGDQCPKDAIDVQTIKDDIGKIYKFFRDMVGKKLIKNR